MNRHTTSELCCDSKDTQSDGRQKRHGWCVEHVRTSPCVKLIRRIPTSAMKNTEYESRLPSWACSFESWGIKGEHIGILCLEAAVKRQALRKKAETRHKSQPCY